MHSRSYSPPLYRLPQYNNGFRFSFKAFDLDVKRATTGNSWAARAWAAVARKRAAERRSRAEGRQRRIGSLSLGGKWRSRTRWGGRITARRGTYRRRRWYPAAPSLGGRKTPKKQRLARRSGESDSVPQGGRHTSMFRARRRIVSRRGTYSRRWYPGLSLGGRSTLKNQRREHRDPRNMTFRDNHRVQPSRRPLVNARRHIHNDNRSNNQRPLRSSTARQQRSTHRERRHHNNEDAPTTHQVSEWVIVDELVMVDEDVEMLDVCNNSTTASLPTGRGSRKRQREEDGCDEADRKSRRLEGLPEYSERDPDGGRRTGRDTLISPPPAYSLARGTKRKREEEGDADNRTSRRRLSVDDAPPSYYERNARLRRYQTTPRNTRRSMSPPPTYTSVSSKDSPEEKGGINSNRKSRRCVSVDRAPPPYYYEHDDRLLATPISPPPAYTPRVASRNHPGCPYRTGRCRCAHRRSQ